jgi:carboxyl-terminal processing protease
MRAVSVLALLVLLSAAKPAAAPIEGAPDPLVKEMISSIDASAVNRVPIDKLALAALNALADHDKCLGRKGEGAEIVLSCRDETTRAPWPPKTTLDAATLISNTIRLLDPEHKDTQERARRAVRAFARAVDDPFTAYLPPEIVNMMSSARFIASPGIEVWPRDPTRIREVRRGSDAADEGVLEDDRLLAIDGVATDKLTFPEINVLLSGASDSIAKVRVASQKGKGGPRDVMVARTLVPESQVLHRRLDGGALYVYVPSFTQGVAAHVAHILKDASVAGVILDLRHNGGGLVPEGIALADLFLRDGKIGGVRAGPGRPVEEYLARRDGTDTTVPLVVIIDGGSASATELVAMVIKERNRGLLIGGATAGKGSVQRQIHLPDGGMLRVTAGYYVGPSGNRLPEGGVAPDKFLAPSMRKTVLDGADPLDDSWVLSAMDALQGQRRSESTYVGPGPAP